MRDDEFFLDMVGTAFADLIQGHGMTIVSCSSMSILREIVLYNDQAVVAVLFDLREGFTSVKEGPVGRINTGVPCSDDLKSLREVSFAFRPGYLGYLRLPEDRPENAPRRLAGFAALMARHGTRFLRPLKTR